MSSEGFDRVFVDEGVHLRDDARGFAALRVLGLARDQAEHGFVQPEWRDHQRVPLGRGTVAGQQVEQRGGVFAELGPAGEQADVRVGA